MSKITIDREYYDRMVDLLQRAEVRIMELQEELETALEVEETDLDFSALEELLKVENPPNEDEEITKDYSSIDSLSSNVS